MEDFAGNDDFGDLYADVELQAASAINSRTSSAKFHFPLEKQTLFQQDDTASNSKDDNARPISERENLSSCPNQSKLLNDSVTVPSHSFESVRRDSEGREFLHGNVAKANEVSNFYAAANSVVSHDGHGFSLPLYRAIYDVNTDTFGGKRWGYQGANMSVLPNFGFNDDRWRQYSMTVPKGRAIEVEDNGGERFPTMDQKCPDNWDSDVVIQIKVQDFDESSIVFSKGDLSGKSSGDKASRICEKSADVMAEASHSGAASGDRVSLSSPEGTRSSQSLFETRESSQHLDNCERDHIPDSDEHHPRRTRAKTAELAEAVESERDSQDESGRRSSKSDQHQSDSDSLIDDKSRFSLTLSCSESDSEPSEDSRHGGSRSSSLGTELHDAVSSIHCKRNGSEQTDIDQRCMTVDSLLNGRRRCENKGNQIVKSEHDLDFPKRNDSSYFRSRESFSGDGGQRWGVSYVEADNREYPQKKRHQNREGEAYTWDRGNCDQSSRLRARRISEILQPKHRYDSLDEEYGRRAPFSGRGISARERGLRHDENARLDSDHLWQKEEETGREYWKAHHQNWSNNNQDLSLRSHTRSYTINQSRWQKGDISRRHDQYGSSVIGPYSRQREELYDSGTYGGCFGSEDNFDSGFGDEHQFAKTKYVWRSRLRQGEESKSSCGDPDGFSSYQRALRHENIRGYGIVRERHFDSLVESNLMYGCEREKMVMMHSNGPVGLVSQRVKLPEKQPARGRLMPNSKPKKKNQKHLNAPLTGRANGRQEKPQTQGNNDAMKWVGTTFQGKGQKNESDIEEGEIITGQPGTKKVKAPQKEKVDSSNAVTNKAVYDEQWILERLAKMEKRRERFKVPVVVPEKVSTIDLNPPSCSQPQVDSLVSTGETKLERPARKRRWAGI